MKKLLLAVALSFGIVAYGDLSAYKWAVIGDSLSDPKLENNTDGPLKYYHYLQQTSGISVVYTNGVGGTGYKNGYDKAADKLADAGCFYQRLEAHPIPSDVDVVTFFGSINDGGFAETDEDLGTATDSLTDKTTLAAYMNKAIDLARAQAPNAKIILIGGIYFSASHATGHVRLNSMLGQIAAARKASGDSNIVNYDWLTEDPDDPLDFHQIIVNQSEEGCFGSLYTYDWKTRGKINESFGHPNPLYNEIWLAPHFGEVLSTELKATLGEVTTTPASNSCALASTVISLGVTSATACDVYLAYGTDEDNLGVAAKILSGLALDDSVAYTIENLEPGTEYFYELSAMNNAAIPEGGVKKGSFVTKRIATPVDGLGDFAKKVVFTVKVGGMPVLLKLSGSIDGFRYSDCNADGSDIRFADAEDNAAPFEFEVWDPSGESLVWVKVPASEGETTVTMYYSGEPSVVNTPSDVWTAYTGVWHFNSLGTDATANSQGAYANSTAVEGLAGHLSMYSVPDEAGVIGKSFKVNDSKPGYHQTGYEYGGMWVVDSGEDSPLDANGVFTVSGWFKHNGTFVYNNVLAKRKDNGNSEDPKGAFFVRMHEQGTDPVVQAYGSGGSVELSAASEQKATMVDNWVYLTFVYNGTNLSIYENGELCKSGTITAATNNDAPLVFGNGTAVADGAASNAWRGWIDEARYTAGVAMSSAQVAVEYAAMADAAFATADAAENVDGAVTPKAPKLGEVSVTVTSTNATISGTITSVGNNGATACDVYLSLDGAAAEKIVEGATVEFEYEIEGLVPETTYAYTLTISNDAATVMGASKSGSFTTEAAPEDPEPIDPPHGPTGSGKKVTYTVNYEGPVGVTDIPVLVRLAANSPEGFAYADCASDGSDIRFQDANGVALPFEIDTWNTAGESLIWVKAPSVEKDTTFTMTFGDTPAAANTPSATWSGYTGVWHFNELVADATANSKGVFANSTSVTGIDAHLSVASTAGEAGKFGSSFRPNDATGPSAGNFDDGGAWVVDSGSDSPLDADGKITISGWIKHQNWNYNYDKIFFKRANATSTDEGGFIVDSNMSGSGNGRLQVRSSDGNQRVRDESYTGPNPQSDWVYVTAVYSPSNNKVWLFENGVQINYAQYRGKAADNDLPLVFGNNTAIVDSETGTGANAWNGWIDEARYIRETKSAEWIAAEYAAMADANFLSAGKVEGSGEEPEPPEEPEEVPVYTLTIPAKTGLVVESVKTNDVAITGEAGAYQVCSNATVTITFAADEDYEITGGNPVVVTVESDRTLADGEYPTVQPVEPPQPPPGDEILPGATPAETRATIQSAIDAAAPTQGTVTLAAGLFEIDVELFVTNGVTLAGQGWTNTVIRQATAMKANETHRVITIKGGSTLEGVAVTGGSADQNNAVGGGVLITDSGCVSWCCVTNNCTTRGNGGGVYVSDDGGQVRIDHTIVSDNTCGTAYLDGNGGGIAIRGKTGCQVEIDACLVCRNTAGASGRTSNGGGIALLDKNTDNASVIVRNTTIADNAAVGNGVGGGVYAGKKSVALVNCLVAGNTSEAAAVYGNADVAYKAGNLAPATTTCVIGPATPVIVGDGDYRLAEGSPAIGAGSTYDGIGNDLDGKPFAATPSIGCYEFGSAPTVPKYEVSWSGAANATVVAEADGNEIDPGTKIGDGTNVVFTVTPDTDYEFAAASYEGWTLTEGVLTRTITVNGEAVSIVIPDATAKVVPPQPTGSGKKVTYTVNYEGPVGVTDIPVLVRLAANSPEGFAYADCASDGSDIRFQDANGVALPFEIDTWNTAGESLIWVKALSVEKDTTFTMTFGDTPAAANAPSATWSGYTGVWHFETLDASAPVDNSQGSFANSTASTGIDGNLSSYSTAGETGRFGSCFKVNDSASSQTGDFNKGGVWVNDAGENSPIDGGTTYTISAWFKHKNFSYFWDAMLYKRSESGYNNSNASAFAIEIDNKSGTVACPKARGKGNSGSSANLPATLTDAWGYVTFVYDGNKCHVYENGAWVFDSSITACVDNDDPLVFGNKTMVADGGGDAAWNGWIDEARFAKGTKSAEWIAAEYAAMADANFLSASAVQDVGPTVPKYEVSWSGAANATVVAEADGNAISSGMKVGDGTNVVFTVTPKTNYEFAAAPYAGWTLTEGVLTRTVTVNGEAVSVVIPDATAKVVPPQPQPEPGEPVDAIAVSDVYPESVPAGYVVTFYAPNKTNPFYVVPASSYTDAHQSSSMNKTFYFRDEDDFEANASAMIGSSCYLFLADAVAVCTGGETIEMLRDDNMVAKTMSIGYPLTIHGNGYTVKVKVPFVDESGFVNTNCTTEVKTIFHIANGGDVFIDDMTIMGGGERLASNNDGKSDATTPAVVVAGDVNGGPNQTGTTGILRMEHVTITRSQGGLFTGIGAKVLLEACNLVRNARYCGGGLYNRGFLVMVDSSLSENRSLNNLGGGAAAENQGMMFMNNCVVCNNGSTEFGGAINVYNNSKIDTDQGKITRLYLMNTTISGNFSSHVNDCGGGIGTHTTIANGVQVYAVNSLICNNSHYVVDADGDRVTASDFHAVAAPNAFAYSVYGTISSSSQKPQLVGCPAAVDASAADVFKDYAATPRVYQHDLMTVPITGATLESDSDEPLARYAPIQVGGKADIGNSGVYTYFDASGWRDGVVKMSYQPFGAETMSEIGELEVATAGDLVTNYYESAFVPNIRARELGVVGASGFGTDVKNYTLTLIEAPVNGSVGNITIFGDSYREGSEVTVTATPDFGCAFVGWYDADDVMVSEASSYKVLMNSDKALKAVFRTSSVINLEVACEQTLGAHTDFPIGVTRAWLAKNGFIASEDAEIDVPSVQTALNAADADNGLRHVWQNYVLGLNKGDPSGRIWINAEQTRDADNIRFNTQPLAPVQGSGFSIRYRFDAKPADGEWTRTASVNKDATLASGQFDVATDANANGNYVIDLIFVPDGSVSSEEYVTTVNTAGVMKVASSKKVEILGAPWAGFSPTNSPAVKATDYAKASCLSEGDVLYVYDQANSNYLAWAVQPDGTWAAVRTYTLANGVVTESAADATRTNDIPRGAGVWLERKDTTKPIFLYGQVDASPVTTSLAPGYNLVANPYPTAFDASTLPVPVNKGDKGDRIAIPTGGAPINAYYKDDAWQTPHNLEVTITNPVTKEEMTGFKTEWTSDGLTLPVGCGFWYFNAGSGYVELTWPAGE